MTRIHQLLGRTIVLVTHDMRRGLRPRRPSGADGRGTLSNEKGSPLSMLASPENDFDARRFLAAARLQGAKRLLFVT